MFPKIEKSGGEAAVPMHISNPVLDFNYTRDQCSALRIYPLNTSDSFNFTCAMKSNEKIKFCLTASLILFKLLNVYSANKWARFLDVPHAVIMIIFNLIQLKCHYLSSKKGRRQRYTIFSMEHEMSNIFHYLPFAVCKFFNRVLFSLLDSICLLPRLF